MPATTLPRELEGLVSDCCFASLEGFYWQGGDGRFIKICRSCGDRCKTFPRLRVNMQRLTFCNCVDCGTELSGATYRMDLVSAYSQLSDDEKSFLPPLVHKRIGGRPYCKICASRAPRIRLTDFGFTAGGGFRRGHTPIEEGTSPWADKALRDWEESN